MKWQQLGNAPGGRVGLLIFEKTKPENPSANVRFRVETPATCPNRKFQSQIRLQIERPRANCTPRLGRTTELVFNLSSFWSKNQNHSWFSSGGFYADAKISVIQQLEHSTPSPYQVPGGEKTWWGVECTRRETSAGLTVGTLLYCTFLLFIQS